jgi:hypothetical protein
MPLISYDASVVINKKAKYKQEKQARPHDSCNARHGRDTHSTNSTGKSTGSARDTVPNKTKQTQGTTTANTILVDSTHKKPMRVVMCCLSLALAQEQSHKTFGEKFGRQS